ncbi:MAG TPA: B12-binding domain-containing radical SAM protein [Chloroflexi bacterium]|nr:B12-binding domain-containing radical SAM protein [Chloroflexota bacterium]
MAKDLDILLIFSPPSAYLPRDSWGDHLLGMSPPIGAMYLAGYLLSQGYTVEILDGALMALRGHSLKQAISERNPRLVGLSSVTVNAHNTSRVAEFVRAIHPEAKIVAGGPHPSFCYESLLATGHVDVVALYEGELTLAELAAHFLGTPGGDARRCDLADVAGIAFRHQGEIILTDSRPLIADLDQLPLPARHLIPLDDYRMPGIVLTGRGCPFNCIFCAAAPLSGRRYRKHSVDRVIEEVRVCVEAHGLRKLFFADDCFTADKRRVSEICRRLEAFDQPLHWVCEGRVDTVTPELLADMHAAGCTAIQYGVESGSQAILDHVRKGINIEQIRNAVQWTVDLGMRAECSLQFGHPEDTVETVGETLQFARDLRAMSTYAGQVKTDFAITTPLPGTYLRDHAEELGIEILTSDWDRYTFIEPVINTRHLTAEQLSRCVVGQMMDRIGDQKLLEGLGCGI